MTIFVKLKSKSQMESGFTGRLPESDPVCDKIRNLPKDKQEEALRELGRSWYTWEQEADEVAVEIATILGFEPRIVGDFNLKNGTVADQKACEELRDKGWTKDGKPFIPPQGPVDGDPHHPNCYRVWAVDAEIQRHGWKKQEAPPLNFPFAWADLKIEALK